MCEVALRTHPAFLLNVFLDVNREITGIFAGEMLSAFRKGCTFVKENAMCAVDKLYDIVITTNGGYPLDQNLYQSVKGMSAANQIIRQGGSILITAACEDGLPDHGQYAALLAEAGSPKGVIDMISKPGFCLQDQWQVQVQAQIQRRADVYVYSDGLTDKQIERALFIPCRNLEQTVWQLLQKWSPRHISVSFPKDHKRSPICKEKYEQ